MAESQWHLVVRQLQRIERFDPISPVGPVKIDGPITDRGEIDEIMARPHEGLGKNGLVPPGYTEVYRVTNDDGTEADYMAAGNMDA
jgi:hypothetical protein